MGARGPTSLLKVRAPDTSPRLSLLPLLFLPTVCFPMFIFSLFSFVSIDPKLGAKWPFTDHRVSACGQAHCGLWGASSLPMGSGTWPWLHQRVLYIGGLLPLGFLCHLPFWARDHVFSLLTSNWKQHLIEDAEPVFLWPAWGWLCLSGDQPCEMCPGSLTRVEHPKA